MLKVENLVVKYGMIEAIKGISFEVNDGEIVTLIGANGAGKTTTMHAISGQRIHLPGRHGSHQSPAASDCHHGAGAGAGRTPCLCPGDG